MFVIATNLSGQRISLPNPFKPVEYIEVEHKQSILAPAGVAEHLKSLGFSVKTISIDKISALLSSDMTKRKPNISSLFVSPMKGACLAVITFDYPKFAGVLIHFEQLLRQIHKCGYHVHLLSKSNELPYGDFPHTFERSITLKTEYSGFDFIISTADGDLSELEKLKDEMHCPLALFLPDPPWLVSRFLGSVVEKIPVHYGIADYYVAASTFVGQHLRSATGKPVFVIEPIPDVEKLSLEKSFDVVMVGRNRNYKGIERILAEFSYRRFKGRIAIISGDRVNTPETLDVHIFKNVSRMKKSSIIAQSRVGVVFSDWEGYGLVIAEMLYLGVPVVVKNVEPVISTFKDKVEAADSVSEAVTKVIELLRSEKTVEFTLPEQEGAVKDLIANIEHRKPKQRVAILLKNRRPIGGGELTMLSLAKSLEEAGKDVCVFFEIDGQGKLPQPLVRSKPLSSDFSNLVDWKPDLIINQVGDAYRGKHASILTGADLIQIVSFWGFLAPPFRDLDKRELSAEDWHSVRSLKGATVIANSEYSRRVLQRFGIQSHIFHPPLEAKIERLPLKERNGVFVSVLEGTDWAYRTFKRIASSLPEFKFVLGFSRGRKEGFPQNVEYLNFVEDFQERLSRARAALLLSSVDHTFCRFAFECAFKGVPIVASSAGNLKLLPNVIRIESSDWEDFVGILKRLLTDDDYWKEASKKSDEAVKLYREHPPLTKLAEFIDSDKENGSGVVFILNDYPGARRHLLNAARLLGVKTLHASNLRRTSFDHPILTAGWMPNPSIIRAPKYYLLFCSTSLQASLNEQELQFLSKALNRRDAKVFLADFSLYNELRLSGYNVGYLPHILDLDVSPSIDFWDGTAGLFNLKWPRKNFFAQFLAIVNSGTVVYAHRESLQFVPAQLRHSIKTVDWLPDDKYYSLLSKMHFGSQVTVGESFNFTAFEFLSRGIPCICSPFKASEFIPEDLPLIVDNPDNLRCIKEAAKFCLSEFGKVENRIELSKIVIERANRWNDEAKERWISELELEV